MSDDLRLHKALRAALIMARSGVTATVATETIATRYELSAEEITEIARKVMGAAISLAEGARASSLRMTDEELLGEACGFVAAMSQTDADEIIAYDPFVAMPRSLAEPLAAVGIVTILKLGEHDAVIKLTERGEVVAMVMRAQRIWPTLSETHQNLLGNPCLSEGSAGASMAIHGLFVLNAARMYRGRSHDGYHYIRTELGRLTWVLGRKS